MKYPEIQIATLANFINGFPFKPEHWGSDGYPIIRIQNLTNNDKDINRTNFAVPNKYFIRKGDILVSWSATIDVFEWDREDALLNQHIFKVEYDSNKVYKSFFKLALKKTILDLTKFAHGSTMKHVVKKDFDNHLIPLPPLDDQKRIAHLLGKVEGMIARRKQHLQQLDELLKSVFLEMFGSLSKPKFNTIDLNNVCIKITDGTHQSPNFLDSGVPFLLVSNITNNEIDFNAKKFISEEEFKTLNERTPIELGDILYTSVGSYGNPALVKNETKFAFQRHIAYLKPDKSKINEVYLYGVLASDFGKAQADKAARGVAQKTVNLCDIKKFILPNPPITLQNKFAAIVEKVESLKSRYQSSLSNLENLYGVLSQKAFKGELDLSRVPMEEEAR